MEFTPQEQKTIDGLRREHGRQRHWRNWIRLFIGFGNIGTSIWASGKATELNSIVALEQIPAIKPNVGSLPLEWSNSLVNLDIALFAGTAVFFCAGVFCLTVAIFQWRPSREEALLLKLVDQLDQQAKNTGKT